MIVFAAIAVTVLVLVHVWLGFRLAGPFEGTIARFIWAGVILSAVALPGTMVLTRVIGDVGPTRWIGVAGFVLMGFWSILVGAMLGWELLRLGLWIWDLGARIVAPGGASAAWWPSDALQIHRYAILGVLALASAMGVMGVIGGRLSPTLERVTIQVPGLDPALAGLRIAQISDIHVGPTVRRSFVQHVVDRVNELEPDIVALTGDLVDGTVADLASEAAPLGELNAPLGSYFVTGNHEYYSGVFEWLDETQRLGFTNLINEHVVVERGGAQLVVAGVTDERAGSMVPSHAPDPVAALAGAPTGVPSLMLAHQPRSAPAAAAAGADLILAGHTHGGQYAPWTWVIHLVEPYIRGLYRVGDAQLWVNRGTGTWGPPLRLGSRPEITLIELQPGG